MAGLSGADGRPRIGGLLRDLAEGTAVLVRSEVRLARLEFSSTVSDIGRGAVLAASAAAVASLGGLTLLVGLILLAGDQWLPRDLYWLAALIFLVASAAIAAWCATRGHRLLATTLDQTAASSPRIKH